MHGTVSSRQPAASVSSCLAAGQPARGRHVPGDRPGYAPHDTPFAARWPLRSFLELGALPGAVPCARLHARQVVWEWGLVGLSEHTELLVSELVTNAVRASRLTRHAAVRLWLASDQAQIVTYVWDASPQPPARAEPGADAESGRGLLLVEAVSERWGCFHSDTEGKVVWALVGPGGRS